jgi:hypothetical protein
VNRFLGIIVVVNGHVVERDSYPTGFRHRASESLGAVSVNRGRLDHAGAVSGRSGGRGALAVALVVVMSLPAGWIALAAVLALLLGLGIQTPREFRHP